MRIAASAASFKNGKHDLEFVASCPVHWKWSPEGVFVASNDEAVGASALGEGAGAEVDDIAILTAVTVVLTASVADDVSSSAVASVEDSDASHSSVDKATVLDASGSEADNSNEALEVLIAPLDYVRSVEV